MQDIETKRFNTSTKGSHYKLLANKYFAAFVPTGLCRRQDNLIFRLRSGHNLLGNHCKWSRNKFCPICPTIKDTVTHLLFECNSFAIQRQMLFDTVDTLISSQSDITIHQLLGTASTGIAESIYSKVAAAVCKFIYHTRRLI